MLKTMLAVFSVPLMANAGVHVNLDPLKSAVQSYQPAPQVDVAQLRQAAQTVAAAARLNAEREDPELERVLTNINLMLSQQSTR